MKNYLDELTVPRSIHISALPQRWDETFRRISGWDSDRLAEAKILVAGAGALGNEVLKNLALLNVGTLIIIDFDVVEYGNLNRSILFREQDCGMPKAEVAARAVMEINPNIKTIGIKGDLGYDLGLGLLRRMNAIVGCLDNRLARLLLNRNCFKVGKTWIDGAIENLAGQVDVFSPGLACYECKLSESDWENIRFRLGCADVAERNGAFGRVPTTPLSASVIGALQATEAVKQVFGNFGRSLSGNRFFFDGLSNQWVEYPAPELKQECASHFLLHNVLEMENLSGSCTVEQALELLEQQFGSPLTILLDYEFVLEICGQESEHCHPVAMPSFRLDRAFLDYYAEVPGEKMFIKKSTNRIDRHFPFQQSTLNEIGIPWLQIITLETEKDVYFVELTGDCKELEIIAS